MQEKHLLVNKEEWEAFQKSTKQDNTRYSDDLDNEPISYPCLAITIIETNDWDYDWLNVIYIYLSDFNREGYISG